MKTRKLLSLVLSIVMVFSLCSTAMAAHLTDEVTDLETTNSEISVEMAKESYILLENNGVLPLLDTEKTVALFGNAAEYTVKGGTGSGDVNQRSRDHIDEAFAAAGWDIVNTTWLAKMEAQHVSTGGCGGGVKDDLEITAEDLKEAKAGTDLAVYSICRNAGEGADRKAEAGDYFLEDVERANIELLAANFDRFVIVFNTCVIDTGWISDIDGIDAIVYMSNGGQRGAEALVAVLEGEVTPSGKLTDTWPVNFDDYACSEGFSSVDGNTTTEWYTDGIYVGYRYFDTFGLDVSYEFGYGLSYTTFDIDVVDVAVSGTSVDVVVDVTNTGNTYSGKEVVQVYFSAPDGTLEKPYQELAAFAKTDLLAPGEKQTLTISYSTEDMSAYSEDLAAYIMEAGEYIIRVGNGSRNTHVAAVATLAETTITEQLSNQKAFENGAVLEEISKEGATPITYAGEADEIANAPRYEIAADELPYANNASEFDDETVTTYLFAEDAENYTARDEITLTTKSVAGIIENNPAHLNGGNGYMETTYAETVEVVPALGVREDGTQITKANAKLTDVYEGTISLEQFVACLSVDEMARITTGGAGSYEDVGEGETTMLGTHATSVQGAAGQSTLALFYTRHIPSLVHSDGPAGLRITQSYTKDDVQYYQYATAFPVGTCYAGSWNTDLYYQMGSAIGSEMVEYGVTVWLAPGMNIHRNALCGRNFEYYSEDPLLSGITAAYVTNGVQSWEGVGVSLKHFWGNNQEANRNSVNNVISERAAREIYLKGFEIAVKLAQPMTVMDCYQENNGWPGSDDYDTNIDILRGEWGFKGYVMTDWGGGQSSPRNSMHAGCDLIMPGRSVTNISGYVGIVEPTFNADGTIAEAGSFTAKAGGAYSYIAYVDGYEALADSVKEAIAAGEAKFCNTVNGSFVTWYGTHTDRIAIGDLQRATIEFLDVALQSQDMVKLYKDGLGKEITIGGYSTNNGALLTEGWSMASKGEIVNVGIVADTVVADNAVADTAAVNVTYTGDEALTSARLYIESDLEVVAYESDYEIEWNDGYAIIYTADGSEIDGVLCTVTYAIADENGWMANGKHIVDLTVVDATGADAESIIAKGVDGAVIIDNTYAAGDVNLDGTISNADVVALARYLVDLVEFNAEQLIAADVDGNGAINNADLIKLARSIVAA